MKTVQLLKRALKLVFFGDITRLKKKGFHSIHTIRNVFFNNSLYHPREVGVGSFRKKRYSALLPWTSNTVFCNRKLTIFTNKMCIFQQFFFKEYHITHLKAVEINKARNYIPKWPLRQYKAVSLLRLHENKRLKPNT